MNFRINFLDSKKNYIGSLLGSVLNGIYPSFCIFVVSLAPGIVFVALVNYLKSHDFFMNLLLVFRNTSGYPDLYSLLAHAYTSKGLPIPCSSSAPQYS